MFSGCPARSLTRQLLGVRPGHRTPAPTEDPQSRGPCRAAPSGPGPSCPGSGSCALEGGLGESCFLRGSSAFSLCYFSVIFKPLFLSPAVGMKHRWLCLFQVSLVLGCVLNSISSSFLRVGTLCLCVHGVSSDFSGHGGLDRSGPVGGSLRGALFWGVSPRGAWEIVPSVPMWTLALTRAEPRAPRALAVQPGLRPPALCSCQHLSRSRALGVGPRPLYGGLQGCPMLLELQHTSLASEFP